jgi:hypothetical protein
MEQAFKRIPKSIYQILDKALDRNLIKNLPSNLSIGEAAVLLSVKDRYVYINVFICTFIIIHNCTLIHIHIHMYVYYMRKSP